MNLATRCDEKKTFLYGHQRTMAIPHEIAMQHAKEGLLREGFGVLFEIDMREKFQEKLGIDFRKYVILGVCNPLLAFEALQEETNIGLFLPCNLVVYEEQGNTVVSVINAEKLLSLSGNPRLELAANVVNERLQRVLESI
ncbi:MAG: DUF302 domain-containing protein [Terriglobia bacterium]